LISSLHLDPCYEEPNWAYCFNIGLPGPGSGGDRREESSRRPARGGSCANRNGFQPTSEGQRRFRGSKTGQRDHGKGQRKQKELHRLMAEKTELERQFNDLSVLRAQVAKLREERNIAQRLEWARQGIFASSDEKGAQKLIQGLAPKVSPQKPSYDLNVEVSAD